MENEMTLKEAVEIIRHPSDHIDISRSAFDENEIVIDKKLHDALQAVGAQLAEIDSLSEDTFKGSITIGCKGPYEEHWVGDKVFLTEHGHPEHVLLATTKGFMDIMFSKGELDE